MHSAVLYSHKLCPLVGLPITLGLVITFIGPTMLVVAFILDIYSFFNKIFCFSKILYFFSSVTWAGNKLHSHLTDS